MHGKSAQLLPYILMAWGLSIKTMFTFLICGRVVSIPLLIYKVVSSFLTDVG
jgi:hypothetical protein